MLNSEAMYAHDMRFMLHRGVNHFFSTFNTFQCFSIFFQWLSILFEFSIVIRPLILHSQSTIGLQFSLNQKCSITLWTQFYRSISLTKNETVWLNYPIWSKHCNSSTVSQILGLSYTWLEPIKWKQWFESNKFPIFSFISTTFTWGTQADRKLELQDIQQKEAVSTQFVR